MILGFIGLMYFSGLLSNSSFGISQSVPCQFNASNTPTIILLNPTTDIVSGNIIILEWEYFENSNIPTNGMNCIILSFSLINPEGEEVFFIENETIANLPTIYEYEVPLNIIDGDILDFEFTIEYFITNSTFDSYNDVFSFQWQEENNSLLWILGIGITIGLVILIVYLIRKPSKNMQYTPQYGVSSYEPYPYINPNPLPLYPQTLPPPVILSPTSQIPTTIPSQPNPQLNLLTPMCRNENIFWEDQECIKEFTDKYKKDPYEFFGKPRKITKI